MEFEPRESRLATIGKRILVVGAVLLGVCLLYWRSSNYSPFGLGHRISLPDRISTIAQGYPFAVDLRNRAGSDASLAMVQVTLRRERDYYMTDMISYYFLSSAGKRGPCSMTLNCQSPFNI
jgi:hypothetical protein